MILAFLKRISFVFFILSTCFSMAFGDPVSTYLHLNGDSLNYGTVDSIASTEYVDIPTSQIFDYATDLANAYAASLSPSELQSTIIRVVTGLGCAAAACVTITVNQDGIKTVQTINFASTLTGVSSTASYGRPGSVSAPENNTSGPSPAAVAAYNSAVSELSRANADLSSANSALQSAASDLSSANRELESARSDARSAESVLNAAISEYNVAASQATAQASATQVAKQQASNSATEKSRIEADLRRKQTALEVKKDALEASKNKFEADKKAAQDKVAQIGERGVMPTEKSKGDTTKAKVESVASHNKAAEGVTKALDLEASAGTIDTSKILESINPGQAPTHKGSFSWPLEPGKGQVTSEFNELRGDKKHKGIDIAVPEGTLIRSPVNGIVRDVKFEASGYGQYLDINVIIDGELHNVILAHLEKESVTVKPGDVLKAGESIGKSGNTGSSSGPHLHFELRKCASYKTCFNKADPVATRNRIDPGPLLGL